MLVLMRRRQESIICTFPDGGVLTLPDGSTIKMDGVYIEICLVDPKSGSAKIGIDAPAWIIVDREEIHARRAKEKLAALAPDDPPEVNGNTLTRRRPNR